jgi:predicted RNA binding protein YcfA (HicA-like mRNA interferase family)
MIRYFLDAGWTKQRSKGSHEVYDCSSGKHTFTLVTGHGTVSSGVVRKAYQVLESCDCPKEGK